MPLSPYESLLSVRTVEELNVEILKATNKLGFTTYGATAFLDQHDGSALMGKLGVAKRSQAVLKAYHMGLLA